MVEDLTIRELLQKGLDILPKGDFSNPLFDVQLLLSYILDVDKIYIYTHLDDILDKKDVDKFLLLVDKRKEGYPIQYIVGEQEFMGLEFYVDENVLVPRQDTEVLIEYIIDFAKKHYPKDKETVNIVDIGTGSGAITLSLAHYIEKAFVYSVDISKKALTVAKKNCKKFNLEDKVKFLNGDLLNPIEDLKLYNKFDIIVSNPPYIPSEDIDKLQVEVSTYEPRLALDGGLDGLDYYKKLILESPKFLINGGLLAFEMGYNQGGDIVNLMKKDGRFKNMEIIKDLAGHDRIVIGVKI